MDYMRGATDFSAAADQFSRDMQRQVKMQQIDKSNEKQQKSKKKSKKTEAEIHQKLSRQIVGMRRGKQFDFTKLDNPDKPSSNQKQGETSIGQKIVFESKLNLNDP